MTRAERLLDQIIALNHGVTYENGAKHLKVRKNGKFVAIIPRRGTKEGLSPNLKAQLRRAGIRLAGEGER